MNRWWMMFISELTQQYTESRVSRCAVRVTYESEGVSNRLLVVTLETMRPIYLGRSRLWLCWKVCIKVWEWTLKWQYFSASHHVTRLYARSLTTLSWHQWPHTMAEKGSQIPPTTIPFTSDDPPPPYADESYLPTRGLREPVSSIERLLLVFMYKE